MKRHRNHLQQKEEEGTWKKHGAKGSHSNSESRAEVPQMFLNLFSEETLQSLCCNSFCKRISHSLEIIFMRSTKSMATGPI